MKLSLSTAWVETKAVIAKDSRLLAAVGLAFFVLPGIVLRLVVPEPDAEGLPPAGIWIAVLLAVLLVSLIGQVAVARMAMAPQISVGEAVERGARRLPMLFAALLLWTIPMVAAGAILYSLAALQPERPTGVALAGLILLCALTILALYLAVRLILVSPVAAAEEANAIDLLKRSFEVTKGNWWRLFAFLILFGIGSIVLVGAVEAVMGVIVAAITGDASTYSVGGLIVGIVVQLVSAVLSVGFFVMLARIYLQLTGRDGAASVPKSGI
ncbi:MAG: glycerophosphoryl diester phosphodiesterase membrane domain-containing protein [Sphingomicrobium sp.]